MVDLVQKEMSLVWAETGDIIQPDDTKISNGWDVELVPRQWWNWMQNRVDHNIAYLLQKGFPEWSATVEYIINKSYVQHLNVVYKCIQTHTNQVPAVGPYWVKAFAESSASLEALHPLTIAADQLPYFTGPTSAATTTITAFARSILDDTSAAAVRTTIGAQPLDATLTALAGVTTGINKLAYFTGTDTVTTTDLTAFGRSLIDDADATAGRATLELGNLSGATPILPSNNYNELTDENGYARNNSGIASVNFPPQSTSTTPLAVHNVRFNNLYGWQMGIQTQGTAPSDATLSLFLRNEVNGAWSNWQEAWHTGNFTPTDYLPKTGGQLTGALTINAPASQLALKSTSDGVAATAYVSFYQSSGTRDGYVGVPSPSTTNFYVQADTGDILLYPSTAAKAVIAYCGAAEKFRTKATGVTVTGECAATTFVGDGSGLTSLSAADIATGTLAVARGGTGTTTSTGTGSVVLSASPTLTGTPLVPTATLGTNTTQAASTAFVQAAVDNASQLAPGAVSFFAMNTAPSGWLKANGAVVSRTTYAALFASIGTTFGAGDGSTTFGLPDLRGEFLRGWDDARGIDASRVFGSAQTSANLSHTHTASTSSEAHTHTFSATTASSGAHTHSFMTGQSAFGGIAGAGSTSSQVAMNTGSAGAHTHTVSGSTSSEAHAHTVTVAAVGGAESRPRNIALLACIKF